MKPLIMASSPAAGSCCDSGSGSTCCAPSKPLSVIPTGPWITGTLATSAGPIPTIAPQLTSADVLGTWMVRWGINRNSYRVEPGLYAIGLPTPDSPVLVTANYKLTFDTLRKELTGTDLWILVLDTKGINVWCAAGKGTFGTAELVHRINTARLPEVVSHRTVILPQLGAPGVSAHEVTQLSGFKVIYGPVRANDVKQFLSNGMEASSAMRTVYFSALDRLVLTPVELVPAMKYALLTFGALFILNTLGLAVYGVGDLYAILGAVVTGAILTPVLLPWIPGRMFALKGALLGLVWAVAMILIFQPGILGAAAYLLLIPAVAAFLGMNFTGASTYTSFSGVQKEMRISVPPMILCILSGSAALIAQGVLRLFS